jgi:hypothetical protein
MAIQQVGGQGVYVITGSGRDPRKTSSGQSWADLVTQQKYMLIKQAQADAKQRIDREYADYDARLKAYQDMQSDIRKQIETAKGDVQALRLKEAEAQIRMKELQYKQEAERAEGRRQTIRTTEGGGTTSTRGPRPPKKMSQVEFQQSLTDEIAANDKIAADAYSRAMNRAEGQKIRSMITKSSPTFFTPEEKQIYATLDPQTKKLVTSAVAAQGESERLQSIRADYQEKIANNPLAARAIIDKYQGLAPQVDTGGGTTTTGGDGTVYTTETYKDRQPVPEAPGVDYGSMITPLEERIRSLEQQLVSGQAPTAPDLNQTDLMRQIATEDYGLQSSYRPPTPPTPTSETEMAMDVLGASGPDGLYPRDAAQSAQIASLVADPVRPPIPFTMQENVSRGVVEEDRPRESLGGLQANQFEFKPSAAENVTPEPEPNIQPYIQPEIEPRIQPRPMQTEIGDALRQEYTDRVLTPPTPTPTGIPRPTGSIQELYQRILQTQKKPTLKAEFDPVKFGTPMQKKQLALEMIMQKAQELGPSNPAYLKYKDQVIQQLDRVLDPKKYRQIKMVEKNQAQNRGDYMALSKQVRGLNEASARLVSSLFPVNEETKAEDADRMYKNAQKQIRTNIPNSLQQKKSNEFLDLMYLAYMQEK